MILYIELEVDIWNYDLSEQYHYSKEQNAYVGVSETLKWK